MKVKFFTVIDFDNNQVLINPMQIIHVKRAGARTRITLTNGESVETSSSVADVWGFIRDYPDQEEEALQSR